MRWNQRQSSFLLEARSAYCTLQRQGVSHLALVIDDDEFADNPHQIIPTENAFALPFLPRHGMEGFDRGYLLPAEVTAFQGIYYHESGDVRP